MRQTSEDILTVSIHRVRPLGFYTFRDQCRFKLDEDTNIKSSNAGVENGFPLRLEPHLETAGLTGCLTTQHSRANVMYIGQKLEANIIITNPSKSDNAQNVNVKVELQNDRGKVVLYDTMESVDGMMDLGPGDCHETRVAHDITDVGKHTLVCSCQYILENGDPRYQPKYFKFVAHNPLVVRTKHRVLHGHSIFLETTIENRAQCTMLLDEVELIPSATYKVKPVHDLFPHRNIEVKSGDSLKDYVSSLPLLDPKNSMSFVYCFELKEEKRHDLHLNEPLGKLDIKWKGPYGENGHLQTQAIIVPSIPSNDVCMIVTHLPENILAYDIFKVDVSVKNRTTNRTGPLLLSYRMDNKNCAIRMDGQQSILIEDIMPLEEVTVTLPLISLESGRQQLENLILTSERDGGKILDTLRPFELYIH